MEDHFLGRGVAFPVETDDAGAVSTAEGDADVEQAIRLILGTAPGERVMRPQFGCGIHERVFASLDTTTRSLLEEDVREALLAWEPRIDLLSVAVVDAPDEQGRVLVEVDYRVRRTNTEDNLVFPFYLEGG